MKSTPASQEPKTGLELYREQLLGHMSAQPDDTPEVRLEHFTAQVNAAYDTGRPVSELTDDIESELQAWDLSGDCSLHSDSARVDFTLAPHFLVGVNSDRTEDQNGGALVTVSILPTVDDAPHGDPCRQRAALGELQDVLISELGAQAKEEPNLNWGTVTVFVPGADVDELSEWPAHLRELGWDVEGSGDNVEEDHA